MITSIVVTGCHTLKMNLNKKIKIGSDILSVEKDIPFIRYRLDSYGNNEYDYITKMKEQFCNSTHLLEIKLDEQTNNVIEHINEHLNNVAKYLYIEINDEDVTRENIDENKLNLLIRTRENGFTFDRYMLKDKSSLLDAVTAKKIINTLRKTVGLSSDYFGICSSPLSFGDYACLTAVKARELMSLYSAIADVALPSANHQCMNCCGCVRYMTVTEDTEAPADSKVGKTAKKKDDTKSKIVKAEDKEKKTSTKKKNYQEPIQLGMYSL